MLACRAVQPLQSLVFDFADMKTALRQFSHARHIGKIVVRVPLPAQLGPGSSSGQQQRQEPNEAWAITGGLGALGSITAEWLVGHGVKYIYLLGRTGRWSTQSTGVLSPLGVRVMHITQVAIHKLCAQDAACDGE